MISVQLSLAALASLAFHFLAFSHEPTPPTASA